MPDLIKETLSRPKPTDIEAAGAAIKFTRFCDVQRLHDISRSVFSNERFAVGDFVAPKVFSPLGIDSICIVIEVNECGFEGAKESYPWGNACVFDLRLLTMSDHRATPIFGASWMFNKYLKAEKILAETRAELRGVTQ